MQTCPKNIRHYFRSVNFHVDEYLRSLIVELQGIVRKLNPRRRTDVTPSLGVWDGAGTLTRKCFVAVTNAELRRGKHIDELASDPVRLLVYAQDYQRWIIESIREEGINETEIARALSYLIEITSRKQKGGQRGVLKSRPVVFERIFAHLSPEKKTDPSFKYRIGGIIEIYNRATYAIDDVCDDSDYRAGEPTLHRVFNKRIAILAGQFLHMWSLELLLYELSHVPADIRGEVIRSFNTIHTSIYEIEIENFDLQERLRNNSNFRIRYLQQPIKERVDYYLKRVDLRTGKFYEHIVRIAVLLATHNIALANEWQTYGLGLGFRYLIDNDLKDLIDPYYLKLGTGSQGLKGKEHESFMGDLEVGKITYPVLIALENNFNEHIINMIGKRLSLDEKNEITKFVVDNGGVDATMKLMEHYADMSKQVLKRFAVKDQTLWELTDLFKFSRIPFEKFNNQGVEL